MAATRHFAPSLVLARGEIKLGLPILDGAVSSQDGQPGETGMENKAMLVWIWLGFRRVTFHVKCGASRGIS